MKALLIYILLFGLSLSLNAQHINVLISTANSPNEPSIFISPLNTDTMIAASNIRNYYVSYDAGYTWTEHTLSSTYGVWGDPVIIADTSGHFYFFHLSNTGGAGWIDRIVCQKSIDAGQTWNNGSFTGLNGTKDQDKHWVIVDQTNNNLYMTWTEFDAYGSAAASCKSRILFSKSLDAGNTWSTPLQINETEGNCIDEDETTEGAVPAVGPNGEIFVAWAGPDGLVFNKSLDQGNTWLTQDIFIDGMPFGWDYSIPGISRANGLPITKCDLSGGPNHGTIYVNWSDQSNGVNNTDVWLSKSEDAGDTWTSPIRVNQDNSQKHQFFTWMDVDQSTGYLYFVYYDRRNYTDNQTDVYMAYSTDGGQTFKEELISDAPFTPNPGIFFGDYTNIATEKGVVRPIWAEADGSILSIHTAIIDTSLLDFTETPLDTFIVNDTTTITDTLTVNDTLYITDTLFINGDTIVQYDTVYLGVYNQIPFELAFNSFPNPTDGNVYFSFKLHKKSKVNLTVYNYLGKEIVTIIKEKPLAFGKHIYSLNTKEKQLSAGLYFYVIKLDGKSYKKRTFVVE
jgi:hypothetical protein